MKNLYIVLNLNPDENGTSHTVGVYDDFRKAFAMATIDMISPDTCFQEGKTYIKSSEYLLISEQKYNLHTRIDIQNFDTGFE